MEAGEGGRLASSFDGDGGDSGGGELGVSITWCGGNPALFWRWGLVDLEM